jgi:hypothetical protein
MDQDSKHPQLYLPDIFVCVQASSVFRNLQLPYEPRVRPVTAALTGIISAHIEERCFTNRVKIDGIRGTSTPYTWKGIVLTE